MPAISCYAVAMASPTHVRFPDSIDVALSAYARRAARPKSSIVVQALSEWLRMQDHPGLTFVTTTTGERRAALFAGPQVWTVAEAWLQHETQSRNPAALGEVLGLSSHEVEAALAYWADNRQEVDELIARHHADQDAALRAWERRRAIDVV